YTVNDNLGATSNQADIAITKSVNIAPVANNDAASTFNTVITKDVVANDTDSDGIDKATVDLDPATAGRQITYTVAGQGKFDVDNTGIVTFTPAGTFTGIGSTIKYTVNDNLGSTSNQADIIITKKPNNLPVANADTFSIVKDSTSNSLEVLKNDTDADGDSLTITGANMLIPANGGTVTFSGGKSIIYKPAAGYTGADNFTYTISDGNGGTSTATVYITVTSASASPDTVMTS
ncbi:MAG TPA: hypothetical protein DCQ37_17980, partial [Desulfobacteraceae bacterium]|nr:hypothetical protein [Desulfobacteraceae bacterium]